MAEHLAEAIFHTLVAALVVEALLRLWRVRTPGLRLRFRLLVMALPLVLLPALEWLAPFRHEPWFEERWALFSGRRWGHLHLLGLRLDRWWLAFFAAAGAALFLRDLVPFLRSRGCVPPAAPGAAAPPAHLARPVGTLSRRLGLAGPPRLVVLDTPAPLLLCTGLREPALVVSRGALERLDAHELEGALAHELGHLAGRDLVLGWGLMAARALQAFNPVLQIAARLVVLEAERRADDRAVAAAGDRLALASALVKCFRGSHAGPGGEGAPLHRTLVARAREAEIEERCRRLLAAPAPVEVPFGRLRLGATALALAALLFCVT